MSYKVRIKVTSHERSLEILRAEQADGGENDAFSEITSTHFEWISNK